MTIPAGPLPQFTKTKGLHSGNALNKLSDMLGSGASPYTALAGGGKAGATLIQATNAVIGTCATAADSMLLPPGYMGLQICLANEGVASAQIFGSGTDVINNVATGTGVAQGAGTTAVYRCMKVVGAVGYWYRMLSA